MDSGSSLINARSGDKMLGKGVCCSSFSSSERGSSSGWVSGVSSGKDSAVVAIDDHFPTALRKQPLLSRSCGPLLFFGSSLSLSPWYVL